MSKGFASNYRSVLLAAGLLVCLGGLGARLVWLHVIARDQLVRTIEKVRHQLIVETARRGDIADANGAILATSRPFIKLAVDPSVLRKEDEKKWPQLAALIGMPELELRKIFTTKFRAPAPANPASAASSAAPAGLVFNLNLTPPPAKTTDALVADENTETDASTFDDDNGGREIHYAKLVDFLPLATYADVEKLGIKGVIGDRTYMRTYPHRGLGAHLLGYVNRAQKPVAGIERYADFYLRGQDGWREGERDGRNRELAQFNTRDVPRTDGFSVTLSLDLNVQDIIEQELARIVETFQPVKATIVVSDPRDGFILGLANYPSFDPNDYNKIPKEEMSRLNNIAATDIYEPGSVFKIVAASGALEERLVNPGTSFDCSLTSIEYKDKVRSLPGEDHHFGMLTVAEIIAHSSNRGAAQLAMRLGDQRFYNYARAFGFGSSTGLPGSHEEAGMMAPPAKWDGLTITRMPMGQSVAVTVMQMHQAMSVIASGGVLMRPQLVQKVTDASGEVVYRFGRSDVRRVVSETTARTMAQLLMGVASKDGTAPEAAIPGYEVAGKTGTTQKIVDGHYSTTHHVASFVGFFPASQPRVAISVIVDDADAHCPGGVAYGKSVAAPSFKRIGEQLISYLRINTGGAPVASNLIALGGGRR